MLHLKQVKVNAEYVPERMGSKQTLVQSRVKPLLQEKVPCNGPMYRP